MHQIVTEFEVGNAIDLTSRFENPQIYFHCHAAENHDDAQFGEQVQFAIQPAAAVE